MDSFIKTIIANKTTCVFLSPHADDAILSCGTLLTKLIGKTPIVVVNVFTKAHAKPYTLSAKTFMKYSNGYTDAQALYKERIKEDKNVFATLGIKPIYLGIEEALFRRKKKKTFLGKILPEFDHIYPTYRWHIIKNIAKNDPAIGMLETILRKYKKKNTIVFAPYGMGNHVDHRVVRKVAENLFDNLLLYSDFPYNQRFGRYGKPFKNGREYTLNVVLKVKSKLIKGYHTQFNGLFTNGVIPEHKEVYFSKTYL